MLEEALKLVGDSTVQKLNKHFYSIEYVKMAKRRNVDTANRVVGFSWNLTYSNRISNTHSAPKGKRSNWGCYDKDLPIGYPGFSGRIWVRYENHPVSFGSSPFENTCVHTGTGGAGNYDHQKWSALKLYTKNRKLADEIWHTYSWDVKIFVEDFPELEEAITFEILKGDFENGSTRRTYQYNWEDNEQLETVCSMFK